MQLKFESQHKSIRSLEDAVLPDFTVITGVNGAGKSHLLEAIKNARVSILIDGKHVLTSQISLFTSETICPQDDGPYLRSNTDQENAHYWQMFEDSQQRSLETLRRVLKEASIEPVDSLDLEETCGKTADQLSSLCGFDAVQLHRNLQAMIIVQNAALQALNIPKLILDGRAKTKHLCFFNEEDFYQSLPVQRRIDAPFQHSFSRRFSDYRNARLSNQVLQLPENSKFKHLAQSEEDFIKTNGPPPWDDFNLILHKLGLPFSVTEPSPHTERKFHAQLISSETGASVPFPQLSSGERVILALAICLFHAKQTSQDFRYPSVLLFDEVDAPLHPSMVKTLLDTIQNALIGEFKAKVILATHSPTTVALAPESAIYLMGSSGASRLCHVDKDKALRSLLEGVPTISVRHENRRNVFVESSYDAIAYEKVFLAIRNRLDSDVSLNFIASSADGKGSCEQVKEIVKQLGHTRAVMGVVDWDKCNRSTEHLKVHAEGERYSIENALLDPVLIVALMLRLQYYKPDQLGLDPCDSFVTYASISQERLQKCVGEVFCRLRRNVATTEADGDSCEGQHPTHDREAVESDENLKECRYGDGIVIPVPTWFLEAKKEKLLMIWHSSYGELKKYRGHNELCQAVLKYVVPDYVSLLPRCMFDLMIQLQESPL